MAPLPLQAQTMMCLRVFALTAGLLFAAELLHSQDSISQDSAAPRGDVFVAAAEGESVKLRQLLDAQPERINARDENGYTALQWAIIRRHHGTIELLLSYQPEMDSFTAAALGRIEQLAKEVRRQSINQPDPHTGLRLLQWAVLGGKTEAARWLLEKGAAVDAKAALAPSVPLVMAIRRGDRDMVKLLLDFGADADKLYPGFGTPRNIAVSTKKQEIVELLE